MASVSLPPATSALASGAVTSRGGSGGPAALDSSRGRRRGNRFRIAVGPSYAVRIVVRFDVSEEDADLTILSAVMAVLADHVLGLVATTRRSYLVEFNRYLDERHVTDRPRVRKTSA